MEKIYEYVGDKLADVCQRIHQLIPDDFQWLLENIYDDDIDDILEDEQLQEKLISEMERLEMWFCNTDNIRKLIEIAKNEQ
jgi:hypothetical protein